MSDKSGIEWTSATWNPVTGCAKVSQGCKNCYAERDWARLQHLPAYSGRAFTDVATHPDRLDQPLRWQRPRRIFVNSMSDLFHADVPFEFIDRVFAVAALCPQHTFQILTKRPERMREYLRGLTVLRIAAAAYFVGRPSVFDGTDFPNVHLGVSVEDQATADARIPILLNTPASVRWISAEPLLGRVDLCEPLGMWWNQTMECFEANGACGFNRNPRNHADTAIDWVVAGGESGPKARPTHPDWVRSLRDQCRAAGVPFFFKQWGEWAPTGVHPQLSNADSGVIGLLPDGAQAAGPRYVGATGMRRAGKKAAGRMLDGETWDQHPEATHE